MTMHRYDKGGLVMDDLRAVAGLVIFGSPLVFLTPVPWIAVALGLGTAVFVLFAIRCAIRHLTVVEVSGDGIRIASLTSTRLDWSAIDRIVLKHYSPRRKTGQGWMQLTLSDGAKKIVIESGLNGFHDILRHAATIIRRNGLDAGVATRANFKAMNISLPATDGTGRAEDGETTERDGKPA